MKPDTQIQVILDGEEDEAFDVTWNAASKTWTGMWSFTNETFNTRGRTASLRLPGARSECRPSEPVKVQGEWMAGFKFVCPEGLTHDILVVRAPGNLPVSYVRRLPRTLQGSVDCLEKGRYIAPIRDILEKSEDVRLQLGAEKPITKDLGLRLDYDVLKKRAKKNGVALHLDTKGVAAALALLHAGGDGGPPTFSGISIDIDEAKLKALGFESVDLTVTP